MARKHLFLAGAFLALPLFFWNAPQAAAQPVVKAPAQQVIAITAEGVGAWYDGDLQTSREEALDSAKRMAVEQASGVTITTESEMKNFEMVRDEVITQATGYVKSYKVVSEGRDNELYKVNIEAQVDTAAFVRGVNQALSDLYKQVGMPTVMVVIIEKDESGKPNPQETSTKEVRKTLITKGFQFYDWQGKAMGKAIQKALDTGVLPRKKILRDAQKQGIDLVIFGSATSQTLEPLNNLYRTQSTLSLDVVGAHTGRVLASDTNVQAGVHVTQNGAMVNALQKAAGLLTPALMEQVSYEWMRQRNEGNDVEVVVMGGDFKTLMAVKKSLSAGVAGVKKVRSRGFAGGKGRLVVTTRSDSQSLAEALSEAELEGVTLELKKVAARQITLQVK